METRKILGVTVTFDTSKFYLSVVTSINYFDCFATWQEHDDISGLIFCYCCSCLYHFLLVNCADHRFSIVRARSAGNLVSGALTVYLILALLQ